MNIVHLFIFVSMCRVVSIPIFMKEATLDHLEQNNPHPCQSHDECYAEEFCDTSKYCTTCEHCVFHSYAIDGRCPDKCPVLCEDTPPQYPKCPLCDSQDQCDLFHDGGLQEEEEYPLPVCNDGSDRCVVSDNCKASAVDYQRRLVNWFIEFYTENSNENATEMPSFQDWEDAGDDYCECFYNQLQCVWGKGPGEKDGVCLTHSQDEIETLRQLPYIVYDWCRDGMKCSQEQCELVGDFAERLCSDHNECGDDQFCNYNSLCVECGKCIYNVDAIDNYCPDKCTVLCEDEPPQYPKCPLCENQEECNLLHDGGLQDKEAHPFPVCNDGSDRCVVSDTCKASALDYQERLVNWFAEYFAQNPSTTEIPPLQDWEDAGDYVCKCFDNQMQCVWGKGPGEKDSMCYTPSHEDIKNIRQIPVTLYHYCRNGMNCSQEQCEWANGYEQGWCHDHDECGDDKFCNHNARCIECGKCIYNWNAIDSYCPDKCPVLCEDEPPQYSKCPLCENKEQCDLLHNGGLQEKEKHLLPICNDGTDICVVTDTCRTFALDYNERLVNWHTEYFTQNPDATEMPPLQDWEDAGDGYCKCVSNQMQCIQRKGAEDLDVCFMTTHQEIKNMTQSSFPFTSYDWCRNGLKCSQEQCEWAEDREDKIIPNITSTKNYSFLLKIKRKIQNKIKRKNDQKKISTLP